MSLLLPTCLMTHAYQTASLSLARISFATHWPWWVWLVIGLLCTAVLAHTYHRIWRRTHERLAWWLLALRMTGITGLLVMLAGPLWTTTHSQTHKPTLFLVIDDSASMSLPAANLSSDSRQRSMSRSGRVKQLFSDPAVSSLLQSRFDVMAQSLQGEALPADFGMDVSDATSSQTDLLRALQTAANRGRNHAAKAVVLVSDGHDTTSRSDWMSLSNYPLPLFTLGFANEPAVQDHLELAITQVHAPQEVQVHHAVTIQLSIRRQGGSNAVATLPVTLRMGDKTLSTKTVTLPSNDGEVQPVMLEFTPDEPGDFMLTLGVPIQEGEKNRSDNQKQIRMRVNNQPMHVLYIEGQLRPEFTFLKARLADDPDINLITFVRTGRPDELGSNLVSSDLINTERLKEMDVILLGDFEADMLSTEAWQIITRWVNQGGGLMVLGGYHNLGLQGLRTTPLADLLPVMLNTPLAGQQLDEPFSFTPTSQGISHQVLRLSDQPAQDIKTWSSLAAMTGLVTTGPSKPAAVVLIRHPRGPSGITTPNDDGYVVLATQNTGQGRTAILTADTTWRWSRISRLAGQPDTQYARFWSQMIRYLALRPTDLPQQPLLVSTDAPDYEPGQRVTLQIQRNIAAPIPGQDPQHNATQPAELTLQIHREQQHVTDLVAIPTSSPQHWTAEYYPDRQGQYEVTAGLSVGRTDNTRHNITSATASWLVQGSSRELEDATPNPELLQKLAELTQGQYAELSDSASLIDLLKKIPSTAAVTRQVSRRTLWNNPLFFLLFLGCVSCEWIIRRRHKLM